MARRNTRLNWFDKLFLGFLLAALAMVPVMLVTSAIADANAGQYHRNFQRAVDSYIADGTQVTGSKAVSLVTDEESLYSDSYVPEEYRTNDPEEVRYLIHCAKGSTVVGYYSGGGVGTSPWVKVTVEDLKTDEILGEKTFYGGNPPKTISVKPGQSASRSGSAPSSSTITAWILDVLEGRLPPQTVQDAPINSGEVPEATEPPTATEAEIPEQYRAAVQTAQDLLTYLSLGPVSLHEWLIDYEECTEEEAAYAVQHCGADWKEQALITARRDLDSQSYGFGPKSLEEALQRDGYTPEQIDYAMENCNPDWKEQALKLAIYHAESTGWSYHNMYRSLMSVYGFSEEEARYGADNCNADWNKAAADHVRITLKYSDKSYTREEMIREMVDRYGFTEEQAIYGVDQHGLK